MPGSELRSFGNAARPNAGGADANVFARAVDDRADAAEVRVPTPAGNVVRVADGVAVVWLFAANFTCECHGCSSLGMINQANSNATREPGRAGSDLVAKACREVFLGAPGSIAEPLLRPHRMETGPQTSAPIA